MTAPPHVVVIGAGTLGICSAHALAEQGARVTVIDAQSVAAGSSGRSVGVVGTQLTDPFQIRLRMQSVLRIRDWEARLRLRFNHIGYLRLARTAEQMELFGQSAVLQQKSGFRSRVYKAGELQQLVPHLSSEGLVGGIFGPDDGFLDPHEMCTLLAEEVKRLGSEVSQFRKVLGASRNGAGYRLETSKGPIECDFVINAAGAWAPQIAEMFGQILHIHPERHEALSIHLDEPLPYAMPMVMDLVNGQGTGLNFRHEKAGELIAEIHKVSSPIPEDPDNYNEHCEESSKIQLAEMLLERVPALPGARLGRGWAGLYPVTADHHPYVGPIDLSEPRLITAAGAGGYGIQLSPVIGLLVADWVLKGLPSVVPHSERLAPTPDRNVPSVRAAA